MHVEQRQVPTSESIIVACTNDPTSSRIPVCRSDTLVMLKFAPESVFTSFGLEEALNRFRIEFKRFISWVSDLLDTVSTKGCTKNGEAVTAIVASFLTSQTLRAHQQVKTKNRSDIPYFKKRLLLAVNKNVGFVGLMLMLPIFTLESPYHLALDLSSRKSRCVSPPCASETHISCPVGTRSILDIRASSVVNTSRDMPDVNDKLRIVQSYELVYT